MPPTVEDHPAEQDDDRPFTVEELTELALAADPDQPLDPGAVPLRRGAGPGGLLPEWYMPAPVTASHKRSHRVMVVAVIVAFVAINAMGLCITYGQLVVA